MKKYLEKYPEEMQNVMTSIFALGDKETDRILTLAIKQNKKVYFYNDEKKIDLLNYSFI